MRYNYKCNGKILHVWLWDGYDHFHKDVVLQVNNRKIKRPILNDVSGERYFVWHNTKVYLNNYISYSLAELDERIKNGDEFVSGDDFVQSILHDGAKNVRFLAPIRPFEKSMGITSSDTPKNLLECYIDETKYKVKEGYKITLKAIDPAFGWSHYYYTDLLDLIRNHKVFIKI